MTAPFILLPLKLLCDKKKSNLIHVLNLNYLKNCVHMHAYSFCVCARACARACLFETLPIFNSQILEEGPFVSHETTGGFRLTNEFLCVLINQATHTCAHIARARARSDSMYRIDW